MSGGAHEATPAGLPRRALGIPFAGEPGPANAITDVPGGGLTREHAAAT